MGMSEIFRMALHNLWQRRVRTFFNLTGIILGCMVLLMTAAAASGVRNAFHALFDSTEFVRQIYIFPGGTRWEEPPEGTIVIDVEMDEARRKRIRKSLADQWNAQQAGIPKREITFEDLDSIRQIPHVISVVPEASTGCVVKTDTDSFKTGIGPRSLQSSQLRDRLLAGAVPQIDDREGVLVDEFLAWKMGYRSDADLTKLVGQSLTIEYRRVAPASAPNILNLLSQKLNEMGIQELPQQVEFLQSLRQLIDELDQTTLSAEQKTQLRELMGVGLKPSEALQDSIVTRQFVVRGIVHSDNENPVAKLFRQWFHGFSPELQIHPDVRLRSTWMHRK